MGSSARAPGEDGGSYGIKQDRKVEKRSQHVDNLMISVSPRCLHFFFRLNFQTRKPLVEKRRRARINESLQELRVLLADSEVNPRAVDQDSLKLTFENVFYYRFHASLLASKPLGQTGALWLKLHFCVDLKQDKACSLKQAVTANN